MTLGFEVLVQDVMAAISTSPWPRSAIALGNASGGATSNLSGVGRLFIISTSVFVLVLIILTPLVFGTGAVSGFWSPPPDTGFNKTPRAPMDAVKRRFKSSADLPYPFS